MNYFKFFIALLFVTSVSFAQKTVKSPRQQVNGTIGEVSFDFDYGAPSVRGRVIWGELVPYDKVWRAGANKNTTLTISKEVMLKNQKVPAGTYGFFIIPSKDDMWTVILSKKNDAWGSNGYDQKNDQLRLKVKANFVEKNRERLQYFIFKKGIGMQWGKARLFIPVQ